MSVKIICLAFCLSPLLLNVHAASDTNNSDAVTAPIQSTTIEQVSNQVNQYCGACHKVPPASVMPKKDWPRAVEAMAELASNTVGQTFIPDEIVKNITAYYYGSAPEALPILPYTSDPKNNQHRFNGSAVGHQSALPLVVNVKSVDLGTGDKNQFLICDAERDQVLLLTQKDNKWQESVLASVKVPSHTEVVDYDGDGDKDIIIAALGLMPPSDELAGKVLLLRQNDQGKFEREVIIEGVGRVTDARPVDLDNDGDLDIALAVFGGGKVGEIAWLENNGQGQHIKHDIISASGALNVSLADINNDGKMDIISLIAQEYEMVLALVNKGAGKFEQIALAEAPHPMFGSTGLRVVDLDGDNDVDMIFTNGDAHDLQMDPKPYHGVQWLENKGDFNFQFHNVGRFYGAASAIAGDLDADGDLDIVAGSWNNYWQDPQRQSLIWFENDGQQNFTRRNIASRPQSIVSFEIKDVNGDEKPDVIAGVFRMDLLIQQMMAGNQNNTQANDNNNANGALVTESVNPRVVLFENQFVIKNNSEK